MTSYACSVHTADLEFAETAQQNQGRVKAQHLIQSFAPGEVTPEVAHEIGYKLALQYTDGKHEFVLATHIDKGHVHNHIIFNQTSFVDHKKFRQTKGSFYHMREINDNLCKSYGLSVIESNDNKALPYPEYMDVKANNSHRNELKNTIDSLIPMVESFDELLNMLRNMDYEIKVSGENYSVKKSDHIRYVRLKNLGDKYTPDAIKMRIKYKDIDALPYMEPPKEELGLLRNLSDTLGMYKSEVYRSKVALADVKRVAATYAFLNTHGINNIIEIQERLDEWSMSVKESRKTIRSLEEKKDQFSQIVTYLKRRDKYKDVYAAYLKSGKDPAFREKHSYDLMIFEATCKKLAEYDIPPSAKCQDYQDELIKLEKKHSVLLDQYHTDVSNLKQLTVASHNIDIILSEPEVPDKTKTKTKAKNQPTL